MTAINKYNKSMIYTIRSPHTEKYYIGSTTQKLCKRFSDHKVKYKLYLDAKHHFVTSFKILELGDAYIELLEEYECDNKTQLEKREGEFIRIHKDNCVNKRIEGRTKKEYRTDNLEKFKQTYNKYKIDNKDKISKYHKQYRIDNKESISKQNKQHYNDNIESIKANNKQYRTDNKDKIIQYRIDNKDKTIQNRIDNNDKIKQHYIDNKESILKQNKQYRTDNNDKIKEQRKQYRAENKEKISERAKKRYADKKLLKALEQEIIIV